MKIVLLIVMLITATPTMAEEVGDLIEAIKEIPTDEIENISKDEVRKSMALYCVFLSGLVQTQLQLMLEEIDKEEVNKLDENKTDPMDDLLGSDIDFKMGLKLEAVHSLVDHLSEHCGGRIE